MRSSILIFETGPVLSGELMARFSKQFKECEKYIVPGTCPQALEWGFRASLFGSGVALLFLIWLWWHMLIQTTCWNNCTSKDEDAASQSLLGGGSLLSAGVSLPRPGIGEGKSESDRTRAPSERLSRAQNA